MNSVMYHRDNDSVRIEYRVRTSPVLDAWAWIEIENGRDMLTLSNFSPEHLRELSRVAAEAADALEAALAPTEVAV